MKSIQEYFKQEDSNSLEEHNLPYVYTNKGVWAGANLEALEEFFKLIKLESFKSFIDLGCGDGRVTIMAGNFTNALGIESDMNLIGKAHKAIKEFNSKAEVKMGDFFDLDLSKFDMIFINPDKGFNYGLEKKLMNELKGTLVVYNNLFLPRFLKQGETHVCKEIPITLYTQD
jgi:16S rRNA G1207 methylase RsmC